MTTILCYYWVIINEKEQFSNERGRTVFHQFRYACHFCPVQLFCHFYEVIIERKRAVRSVEECFQNKSCRPNPVRMIAKRHQQVEAKLLEIDMRVYIVIVIHTRYFPVYPLRDLNMKRTNRTATGIDSYRCLKTNQN